MQTATDQLISTSLDPIPRDRFGVREARHLLLRVGFGGTPDEIAALVALGPDGAVDQLLDFPDDPADADAPARTGVIRELTAAERSARAKARKDRDEDALAAFREREQAMRRADWEQFGGLQRWWMDRLIASPSPAREKLTLFWHGHFATSYRGHSNSYHLLLQNRMFRRLALGPFSDLARGIIHDPAMLAYLNNNSSNRRKPNENLARELMELFTLGEGNYTERDIKEGARALTGYSFRGNQFYFRESWHDADTKMILGARGNLDGDGFVNAILGRPDCSRFIAHRLYRFYSADIPDNPADAPQWAASIVHRLAGMIRADRYNLRRALRTLFRSEHFYDPAIIGAKIKSPADLIASAARSLNLTPAQPAPRTHFVAVLTRKMGQMGQALFLPPSVAGWSGGRAWINTSTLFQRQNTLTFMLSGQTLVDESGRTDPRDLFPAESARGAGQFSEALLRHALGELGDPSWQPGATRRRTLDSFFSAHGGRLTRVNAIGAVALVTAMPEYQVC